MSEPKAVSQKLDYSLLGRLLTFLRPYRLWIVLGFAITIVSSALGPYRPMLVKEGIDEYIKKNNSDGLLLHVLWIFAILIMHGILQYALTYVMQWVGQRVLNDVRLTVFNHIQKMSLRFFDKTPVGRLVTRVTNDVEALNELFSSGVVLIFSDILVLAWIVGFMFYIDWKLALLTIAVLPALLVAASIFRKKVRIVYGKIRIQVARINSFLNEYISGITTIQLFGQESAQYTTFDDINTAHTKLQIQSITYYAVFFPVVEMLSSVAICLVLWYAAGSILSGFMTIGTLISFAMYAEMFFRPVRDLTEKYNTLQSAITASERIFELLDTKPEHEQNLQAQPVKPLQESIEFKNVSFSYDGERDVLNNVSFRVKKGDMVAIVGATGSGKSTIINLLCRFYDYNRGEIMIDGKDIRSLDIAAHRARIALVLQDVFLFSRSVEDNIRIGRDSISNDTVHSTAQSLGASFIDSLPQQYNTQVMERGMTLSTGQKQLISFTRAVVSDPELLILDEATSSIDTETEQMIDAAIDKLLAGRTSLVIAHRLSTIQRADTIIVLHHGEVAEQGSHEELLKANGIYARLHALQYAAKS